MGISDFEAFYRSSRDSCFRALIVAVGDPVEADDLLAEAYTRAIERWPTIRTHPAPVAWVLRVAMNLQHDRWRRARRALRIVSESTVIDPPDPPIDPMLLRLIGSLPDQQRRVLAMRVMLDLDTSTTAEMLGVTAGTVTTHLHRALRTLRTQLQNSEVLP